MQSVSTGQNPPGQFPTGQIPPGQFPPSQVPTGQFPLPQPATGGQFQPVPPPKKKRNPFATGCLGILGFFLVVGVIGNLAGGGKGNAPVLNTGSAGHQSSVTQSPAPAPSSPAAPSSSESSSDSSSTDSSEPAPISVSTTELAAAYNANEVSADEKYKGKVLAISGTVDTIGKDILDTPYVTLHVDEDMLGVQCMFDNQYKAQLAQLRKGQRIRLHGTCKGKTLNVILDRCSPV